MIYLTNGNMPLNAAYSDEIVQEDNSTYQLSFRFPTSNPLWEKLKEETFLTADDLHGEQDFVIFEVEKKHGYIQVYANQVFTLLNNYVVNPISLDRQTGSTALSRFAGSITRDNPFSFFSDIEDRHTFNVGSKNAMEVFAKDKHSIIGQWGGDLVRHGYQVRLLKNGGSENESLFMYKKNLSSYQHKTSTKSLKTRITFIATVKGEGEKAPDRKFSVVVDSPLINKYSQIYEDVIEVNDEDVKDEASLRKYGEQYFKTSLCDMMEDSLELEVVGQSDVPVQIYDIVSLFYEIYNLDVRKKITKYTYSPMAKKLKSIGFGQFQSGLANAIGNAVSDAVKGEAQQLQDDFERQLARELKNADLAFDRKTEELQNEFTDGLNAAKARAEEVKREMSDTIDQRFNSFNNGPLQEAKRRAEEALRNAGASSLLAQEAKRIGLESVAKLEEFKRQATSAQTALSGDLDDLKRTVANEVNQASEYRRTTTEALSRMTGQMDGFATKSEVKQGIDGLTQTFAKMKVGGRNYAEDYDFSRGLWQYNQGDSSPQDWTILNGEYNVKGTTKTWKQLQIHSKEGSRASGKNSTALLELEVGDTYTLSFQGICYSGSSNVWASLRANRTVPGNPEIINGNFKLTSSWQTYQVTIPALAKPDNFDFWRIILGYSEIGHVAFRKVELTRSSTRIDAGPAPEDGKTDLVVAKSEFQKTAEGLRTDLSAIQEYVNKDGQRKEELQRYTREESARQATAVRELVSLDFVGKAIHQEDIRGINQRIEEAKKNARNELTTRLANYRQTVDGKFTDISSQVTTYKQVTDEKFGDLSNQILNNKNSTDGQIENVRNQLAKKVEVTDFQHVQETSKLYERILGTSETGAPDKLSRLVMSSEIFQTEVGKYVTDDNNLIVNSMTMDKNTLVGNNNPKASVSVADGIFTIKAQGLTSYNWSGFTLPIYVKKIYHGETYTLGFKYRIREYPDVSFAFNIKNHGLNKTLTWANIGEERPVLDEWHEFQKTFTIQEDFEFGEDYNYPFYIFLAKNGWIEFKEPILVRGSKTGPYKPSQFDDMSEAIRTVQSQLAGSWAVQNLTSAGSIVSQINATNNQILIEAEKIRLKGKTLLDELTAIQGYFKRLFVGEGTFATLNADVIRTNSITADKLVMDMAMARRFVSSDLFTDTLAAKEAFINKLRSVVVTATLLEGYRGRIGGFQIGTHDNDPSSFWLTGLDQFKVGMSNGRGREFQTAFWANWGNTWGKPGALSWYVTLDGQMYCNNDATFHRIVDFSSTCSVNFYGANSFYKDIYMRSGSEIYGTGSTPRAGGKNSVVWWNQVGDGSVKYHIDRASDKRLKENIVDSNIVALDKIKQLKMKSFDFISTGKHEEVGLIAQEVEAVLPSVISKNPEKADDYLHIDYVAIVPYLIKSIQELNQKIEEMEKTVA